MLTPFIRKPHSSRDLTIFMILFIPSFEISNAVHVPKSEGVSLNEKFSFEYLQLLLKLPPLILKDNMMLLAKGVSKFFINNKAVVINGLRKLRNLPS